MKITVLSRIGDERLHEYGHTVMSDAEATKGLPGTYRWESEDGIWSGLVRASDEGILWIRGHHVWDSKEVQAMRVAYALGLRAGEI